ncbi:MAG: hypothetical protein Q8K96_11745 [Rubrivivax sp.]|nr:hypothetical protein [Rubrivivax sp.]
MARTVPAAFEREQGCTEVEWLRWLPGAVRGHALALPAPGQATVAIAPGCLHLAWTVRPPRQIALMRMPRMEVSYRFEDVDAPARSEFMRYFDLYLHRGGG